MEHNRFKWARQNIKHESVKTVAEKTGISRSLIDDLETNAGGKRNVGYLNIKRLAQYYNVSVDWLLEMLPFENWSIDADKKKAAVVTGLTDAALSKLSEFVEAGAKEFGTDILSAIITHEHIIEFLYNIMRALEIERDKDIPNDGELGQMYLKQQMFERIGKEYSKRILIVTGDRLKKVYISDAKETMSRIIDDIVIEEKGDDK